MNNKLIKITLSVLIILYSNYILAKIYKWQDGSGNIHYSDIPPQNDKRNKILELDIEKNNTTNKHRLIKKTNKYKSKVKSKLKDYKTIKEHHYEEAITPRFQKTKPKVKSPITGEASNTKKYNYKKTNCEIAKNNLEQLNSTSIFLARNNKITNLSQALQNKKIRDANQQIKSYC